jgi:hypothetical protein
VLITFALEYINSNVQENKAGLGLNGTQKLLVSADDVNYWAKTYKMQRLY